MAAEVTLAWTPSPSANIVEYRIYQSMLPRQHALGNGNEVMSVSGSTYKATLPDILPGRYYWVVTAVNNMGQESSPSNEVGVTIGDVDHDAQNSGMDYYIGLIIGPTILTIIQIG